jgi:hypothetical protein
MPTRSRTAPLPRTARFALIAAATTALTALIALTASAATAASTPGAGPDAKYYVSSITGIEPAEPGLDVVVHGGGEAVTLTNRTGKQVVVVGYSGEDFLRITGTRVDENTNSLTAVLNQTQGRSELPKKFAAPGKPLPPKWHRISDTNSVTWRDFRTRWSAEQRPPIVAEHPHSRHQVFVWAIQIRVDKQPALVRGAVTWTGTPRIGSSPGGEAIVGLLVLVALLALAIALLIGQRRRRARLSPAAEAHSQAEPSTTGSRY